MFRLSKYLGLPGDRSETPFLDYGALFVNELYLRRCGTSTSTPILARAVEAQCVTCLAVLLKARSVLSLAFFFVLLDGSVS